jgi:hypothetical protein
MEFNIYHRAGTGMQTPQERPTDFFTIEYMGVHIRNGQATAKVNFYEHIEDAINNKAANNMRVIDWPLGKGRDVPEGIATLLEFENFPTASEDEVSFSGATIEHVIE